MVVFHNKNLIICFIYSSSIDTVQLAIVLVPGLKGPLSQSISPACTWKKKCIIKEKVVHTVKTDML